jgi:methyl-accepting chemotaxis protein
MMDVVCNNCGKQYKVDLNKIKGPAARLKCKACDHIMTITKPPGGGSAGAAAPPRPAAPAPAAPTPAGPAPRAAGVSQPAVPSATTKVRFGLVGKVISIMLIVGLVPFGVFWGLAAKETARQIRIDNEQLLEETAHGLSNQVDEWLDKNVRLLRLAARLPQIRSMNRAEQEKALTAIQEEYPYMYLVFTTDIKGINVARSDGKPLKDYSDRQYVKDIVSGKALTWQTLIGKTSKKPALVMAVPIMSGETLVGVMAAAMTRDDISRRVATWSKGQTGYAFLADEKGKAVSHQNRNLVLTQSNMMSHPLVAEHQRRKGAFSMHFINQNGKDALGYVIGNKYGWVLVVEQEAKEVFATLNRVQRFAVTLLMVTIVVVLLVSWMGSRALVRPIRELTQVAERMSMGELDIDINIRSKDEIGLLAQAIGRMQTSLRLAMERLRKRR